MGKTSLIVILLFFLQAVPTNRQLGERINTLQEQVQVQQQTVSELSGSQQLTDKALNQLSTLVETTNSSINNTLSVTNIVIALAALLVAVAAILLGNYISRMERKMKSMSDEVTAKEAEVKKLFNHTFCPDELFIQTVCFNSPFKDKVRKADSEFEGNLRFIKWVDGELFPITKDDIPALRESDRWFARKFSSNDMDLVNVIKEMVNG